MQLRGVGVVSGSRGLEAVKSAPRVWERVSERARSLFPWSVLGEPFREVVQEDGGPPATR